MISGLLALPLALAAGDVAPIALPPLLLLSIAAVALRGDRKRVRQVIWRLSVIILPLVIALGSSGAFSALTLLDDIRFGHSTSSYAINVNMSKPLIALILLATVVPTIKSWTDVSKMLTKTISILAVGIPVVAVLSSIVGYTQFDFKLQMVIVVWGIFNLFITCIAEEVFFRGFILKELLSSSASFEN